VRPRLACNDLGMVLELNRQTEPTARGRRRGMQVVLAVVVVLIAAYGAFWLVAKPSPASFQFSKMHAVYGARTFSQTVIVNGGGWDERIIGVSVSGTGIALVGPVTISARGMAPRDASHGMDFRANARLSITAHFRVSDCQDPHLATGPIPLRIHVQRLWFSATDTVVDHGQDFPDAGKACGLYH
jgi:hypothetical protein